jgi:hypothetical protein
MNYRLVITTDGRPEVLDRTLDAFDCYVRPRPSAGLILDDSGDEHYLRYLKLISDERRWALAWHPTRQGFCRTVADAWATAAGHEDYEWIFWLEDDFEFTRAVDLTALAHVLDHEARVVQMAFYRNAVSNEEIEAGGYIPMRPGAYERRGAGTVHWFEHRVNWTTNPSLFRRSFAWAYPWPVSPECEGRFGIDLRERRPETTFGIWGAGEPWVTHFGERKGSGY